MEFNEIMQKSDEHVKAVSQAMRNLEIAKGYEMDICHKDISVNVVVEDASVGLAEFLPDTVINDIKTIIVSATKENYQRKYHALRRLMGIDLTEEYQESEKSNAATIIAEPKIVTSSNGPVSSEDIEAAVVNIEEEILSATQRANDCNVAKVEEPIVKPWESEDQLRMDYIAQGKSVKQMAKEYGCLTSQIYTHLKKYGISKPSKNDDFVPGKQDYSKRKK